ncbi:MAG: transposase [Bacteroidota bacterium]
MDLHKIYFYTATILGWKPLLTKLLYKELIIQSLKFLKDNRKIVVYGFVIMPNHIHLIWELLEMNGKESPHSSFMKYVSHEILKDMVASGSKELSSYAVVSKTRKHQFWQRGALPIHLYKDQVIYQKLDYVHNNPVQGKWMLADSPIDYHYSSARFYEYEQNDFGILTHIGDRV